MAKLRRTAISRSTVGRLKADGDTVFWDSELQGFGVRVYASGRKIYVVQTRAGGPHPTRVTVGRVGVITPEEARRRAAQIISRIKAGEEPVPEPEAVTLAKGPTVGELVETYLKEVVEVRLKPKSAKTYRGSIDNHILPALGRKPALSIDHAAVSAFHHSLRETPSGRQPGGRGPVPDLPRRRGAGDDPGGQQPLPPDRDEPAAPPRALPDR